ncbi:MAG: GlsB/YeaQ/YmgE family stress response membrane protein [Actinomycetes bacterium]
MHTSGIIGVIVGGLIIGALGRLVLPGRQPIGCLLTTLIGVVGAGAGYYLGHNAWKLGDWATFFVQILIAALLVALFTGLTRKRRPPL